jgi:hypothetical protein
MSWRTNPAILKIFEPLLIRKSGALNLAPVKIRALQLILYFCPNKK